MPQTNYERGRAFEYRAKHRLEADGWLVFRTAGSHSPVDLLAFKPGFPPMFVQCGLGRKSKADLMRLVDLAEEHGATPVLVSKGMRWEFLREQREAA